MKTAKNQKELYQQFVDGVQDRKCGNVFIENGILYSYGHHYILEKRTRDGIWVNDEKYSQTTLCQRSKLIGVLISNGLKSVGVYWV